ncbi:hypothetical protein EI94DRAFT_1282874 [Lactarius quietus]|nr:hypothetical protein EI94DRAFT_1282874 [Lactarius quietus]
MLCLTAIDRIGIQGVLLARTNSSLGTAKSEHKRRHHITEAQLASLFDSLLACRTVAGFPGIRKSPLFLPRNTTQLVVFSGALAGSR